jgi:hypothetical protein
MAVVNEGINQKISMIGNKLKGSMPKIRNFHYALLVKKS